jgi:hypothetical protein
MAKKTRKPQPRRAPAPAEPPQMIDLEQFESVADALKKIEPGDRYLNVARLLTQYGGEGMPMTIEGMFWSSMLTRIGGLHGASAREIGHSNPHAAFPLIRTWAETIVMLIYVTDHPEYIDALTDTPRRGGRKRKSIQALINYASRQATGMKTVYADLSEATHFGSIAMWASHTPTEKDGVLTVSWTSYPRFRDERQQLIACGQVLELSDVSVTLLENFFDRYLRPLTKSSIDVQLRAVDD